MSISVPNSKKVVSTHGKQLLRELCDSDANLERVISFVDADPFAGRLKDPDYGNNAYHYLLGSSFSAQFVVAVLRKLLEKSPEGIAATNKNGTLPLHMCLSQPNIVIEAAVMLIQAYPESAGIPNSQGFTPLFLCVMRDNPNFELCKLVCKTCPTAPSTQNRTKSLPLHFAVNRRKPNKDVVRMLLRRHAAAASVVNEYGVLPIHCAAQCTDDVEVIRMLYEAYADGIKTADRQGRTCLHLAVMAMGKEHEKAVSREEEEEEELSRELSTLQINSSNKGASSSGGDKGAAYSDDDDDDEVVTASKSVKNELVEREGRSREVIRFLVTTWPQALVTENNFQATPVETVLEKSKRIKQTKSRKIQIYGLFDDPPTARLLLTAQKYRAEKRLLPGLRPRLQTALRELNWLARRDAMLIGSKLMTFSAAAAVTQDSKKSSGAKGGKKPTSSGTKKNSGTGGGAGRDDENMELIPLTDDDIPKNNILARLRRRGFMECVRLCFSWI
jgi:ankyrin repeat protein